MQPSTTSIWLHDSNETASGKPGTLQLGVTSSETDRADVVRAQQVLVDHRQPWLKKLPERLVFIDETGNHNQDDAAARPGTQGEAAEDESALWSLGNTNLHRSAWP